MLFMDGDKMEFRFINDILESLGHEASDTPKPDVESEDTWIVCGASATWHQVPLLQLNHWFPAWTKKRLGDEWEASVEKSKEQVDRQKSELAAKLVTANETQTIKQDSEAKALLDSLLDEWDKVVRKQDVLQKIYDLGVCPFDVPGDGDCGIHAALSLLNGAPHCTSGKYESHEELSRALQEKRSESSHFVFFSRRTTFCREPLCDGSLIGNFKGYSRVLCKIVVPQEPFKKPIDFVAVVIVWEVSSLSIWVRVQAFWLTTIVAYAEELKQTWLKAKGRSLWQDLFCWFGEADALIEEEKQRKGKATKKSDPPQTPSKGPQSKTAGETPQQSKSKSASTSTPKRKAEDDVVTPVKKRGQVHQSGDLGLKTPPHKSEKPNRIEFGRAKHQDALLARAKEPVVLAGEDDPLALNEGDDDADIFAKLEIRRAKHHRVGKKPVSEHNQRRGVLKKFLASLSLDWGAFQHCHRR